MIRSREALLAAEPVRAGVRPLVSFEFFPPKTPEMEAKLWRAVKRLEPLGPALRLGDLRRRRHRRASAPTPPCCASAPRPARARGASDLRRRQPSGDRRDRCALLGGRHPPSSWRCAATRRRARALPAASRRLCLRRRAGRRAAPRRRFRDQRRGISRDPSRGARAPPPISTISSARSMPAPPAPSPSSSSMSRCYLRFLDRAAAAGITRADRAGHPAGDAISPRCEKFAAACGAVDAAWMAPTVRRARRRSRARAAWSPPRRRRAMPAAAGGGRRRVPFLHPQPRRSRRRHLPHDRRARARRRRRQPEADPMPHILDYLARPGAAVRRRMGTQMQARHLDVERRLSRPRELHRRCCARAGPISCARSIRGYLARRRRRGADQQLRRLAGDAGRVRHRRQGLSTSTAAPAELAREAVDAFAGDGRSRFVIGSIGPGTRLPSLGHIDYQTLEDALTVQCRGLIAGGVDAILIETCQDTLQIKAAVNAAKRARLEAAHATRRSSSR